jgi:hypothetical protein
LDFLGIEIVGVFEQLFRNVGRVIGDFGPFRRRTRNERGRVSGRTFFRTGNAKAKSRYSFGINVLFVRIRNVFGNLLFGRVEFEKKILKRKKQAAFFNVIFKSKFKIVPINPKRKLRKPV